MQPQPFIAVWDVEASSQWYQNLLGCQSGHGGDEYERLMDGERIIIQLHRWDTADDHPHMGNPDSKPYGNGAVPWFQIDDFDAAVQRATDRQVEILEGRK